MKLTDNKYTNNGYTDNGYTDNIYMKKIGLVLSGGGARGIAHLGVLKSLVEQKIPIDYISGCSAGSIAGVMFAAGYSPDHIFEIVVSSNTLKAFRPAFSRLGLLRMQKAEEIYLKYLPHNSFENLKLPLFVNATDIMQGESVFYSSGELIKPVLASCSIPGLFEPVTFDGRVLVDGGVLNNMPIEPLQSRCDFIIGSHCNPFGKNPNIKSIPSVLQKSLYLAINNNSKPRLAQCNLLIEPPALVNFEPQDVRKAKEIFKAGYDFASSLDLPQLLSV
ncbi:patatin-like phospholipase family protein [Flectobacillus rivi]|uniref:Patatin-like phospholipase family protein n=1 Tax=Flectobacillus rivi TaxID=2984209 RepID=A0ABT6YYA9_9BACT|nr:patatin-like phospholipase family protein [Flectobacillus rivi]MDI9873341.1 patatin-like phospholipase family protein [Flectobacillus rivi]